MGWVTDLFGKIWGGIGNFIDNASTAEFAWLVAGLLLILTVVGVLVLWWYILFKGTNRGGYH